MNTYEWLLDYINVLSFAIGVENLRKNEEQINSLEEHLSKQDSQYNEIIELLKEVKEEKHGE